MPVKTRVTPSMELEYTFGEFKINKIFDDEHEFRAADSQCTFPDQKTLAHDLQKKYTEKLEETTNSSEPSGVSYTLVLGRDCYRQAEVELFEAHRSEPSVGKLSRELAEKASKYRVILQVKPYWRGIEGRLEPTAQADKI